MRRRALPSLPARMEGARARARAVAAARKPGVVISSGVRFGRRVSINVASGGSLFLGEGVELGAGTCLMVGTAAHVTLEDGVFVGSHGTIAAREAIFIGRDSMLAEFVSIRDHDHDPKHAPKSGQMLVGPIRIGAEVWIGGKVTIARGTSLGDRAVVGAHAMVRGYFPGGVLVVGVPARLAKHLAADVSPDL